MVKFPNLLCVFNEKLSQPKFFTCTIHAFVFPVSCLTPVKKFSHPASCANCPRLSERRKQHMFPLIETSLHSLTVLLLTS